MMNKWLKKKFSKLLESIKNNPYTYSFWIGVIAILIPLLTWVAYYIGDYGFVLIHTSLSVGDALGFYGSFLAFLGTVALGALALWQNKSFEYRQFKKEMLDVRPFFAIVTVSDYEKYIYKKEEIEENIYSFLGKFLDISKQEWIAIGQYVVGLEIEQIYKSIIFKNMGNIAHNVQMYFLKGDTRVKLPKLLSKANGEEIIVYIQFPFEDVLEFTDDDMCLILKFNDIMNNTYEQKFIMVPEYECETIYVECN